MKRILEQPKIIVYENVDKVVNVLEDLYDEDGDNLEFVAEEILKVLGIDKGKKTVIELFENNVQAVLEDDKITLGLGFTLEEASKSALEAFKLMK